MTTFSPGDKVLFHQGPGYVGFIHKPFGSGWTVTFNPGATTGAWLCIGSLTKLPADTPVYRTGTPVQVRSDAPYGAGSRGTTCGAEIHGAMFGYWMNLDDTGERAWVPAEVLEPINALDRS